MLMIHNILALAAFIGFLEVVDMYHNILHVYVILTCKHLSHVIYGQAPYNLINFNFTIRRQYRHSLISNEAMSGTLLVPLTL